MPSSSGKNGNPQTNTVVKNPHPFAHADQLYGIYDGIVSCFSPFRKGLLLILKESHYNLSKGFSKSVTAWIPFGGNYLPEDLWCKRVEHHFHLTTRLIKSLPTSKTDDSSLVAAVQGIIIQMNNEGMMSKLMGERDLLKSNLKMLMQAFENSFKDQPTAYGFKSNPEFQYILKEALSEPEDLSASEQEYYPMEDESEASPRTPKDKDQAATILRIRALKGSSSNSSSPRFSPSPRGMEMDSSEMVDISLDLEDDKPHSKGSVGIINEKDPIYMDKRTLLQHHADTLEQHKKKVGEYKQIIKDKEKRITELNAAIVNDRKEYEEKRAELKEDLERQTLSQLELAKDNFQLELDTLRASEQAKREDLKKQIAKEKYLSEQRYKELEQKAEQSQQSYDSLLTQFSKPVKLSDYGNNAEVCKAVEEYRKKILAEHKSDLEKIQREFDIKALKEQLMRPVSQEEMVRLREIRSGYRATGRGSFIAGGIAPRPSGETSLGGSSLPNTPVKQNSGVITPSTSSISLPVSPEKPALYRKFLISDKSVPRYDGSTIIPNRDTIETPTTPSTTVVEKNIVS